MDAEGASFLYVCRVDQELSLFSYKNLSTLKFLRFCPLFGLKKVFRQFLIFGKNDKIWAKIGQITIK